TSAENSAASGDNPTLAIALPSRPWSRNLRRSIERAMSSSRSYDSSEMPNAASTAETIAPAEVPAVRRKRYPASVRTLTAPTSPRPRTPPPSRIRSADKSRLVSRPVSMSRTLTWKRPSPLTCEETIMRPLSVLCVVAALVGPAVLSGCGSDPGTEPTSSPDRPTTTGRPSPRDTAEASPSPSPTTPTPSISTVSVDGTVARELTSPWGLVFLPNGDALVSERDTALVKRVTPSGQVSRVGRIDGVVPPEQTSEGGLLGLAYRDKTLYAYVTSDEGDNRIVKMAYDPDRPGSGLGAPEVILDGIPSASYHNGGRIVFGPDGHLYVGTG